MAKKKKSKKKLVKEPKNITLVASETAEAQTGSEEMEAQEISLADLVNSGEPLPEYLEIDEVLELLPILPEERLPEFDRVIEKFVDSLDGKKPEAHNGWFALFLCASPGSFEEKLGILMMITTARTFVDWLTVCHAADGKYPPSLKRMIVDKMLAHAKTLGERLTAEARVKKINGEEMEVRD